MIEAETKFPTTIQTLFFNGQALRAEDQTLEQADIKDGEMLAVMVRRPENQNNREGGSSGAGARSGGQGRRTIPPEADTPDRIEGLRQEILNNPAQLSGLIEQSPDLADAIHDQTRFYQTWMRMINERNRMQREREDEMKMLNERSPESVGQNSLERFNHRLVHWHEYYGAPTANYYSGSSPPPSASF